MGNQTQTFVIVGAGPAGGQAAQTLRHSGFKGHILLIGAEPYLPYERPPLSKGVLMDSRTNTVPLLPGADHLVAQGVEFLPGVEVQVIDRDRQLLNLSDGCRQHYDRLLLTTGARVRRLDIPGSDKQGVCYLRTFDDCIALRSRLKPGISLVVIGGGFIGLEAAASARQIGCDVTVIEAAPQLMGRVLPPIVADYFSARHAAEGVAVKVGVAPMAIEGEEAVSAVLLANGERVAAEVVLIGIGVIPNAELAEQAGLKVANGIVVDQHCRTSDPAIFAAGDVTWHYNNLLGKSLRLEAWQAAINQATIAAAVMCGDSVEFAEVPWVWSDQYDVNMQIAGHVSECDEFVVRGDPAEGNFSVFQLHSGQVVGVMTINRGAEMSVAKRMIGSGRHYCAEQLADDSVKLRKLVKSR